MIELRLGLVNNIEKKFIPTKKEFLEKYLDSLIKIEEYEIIQTYKENIKYRCYIDDGKCKYTRNIKKEKVSPAIVSNYVQYVIDSFLISMAKRYDVKGKTYFKYPNKYYYTDIGLRNARLNYRQYDPGHIMENIIYNELLRQGYSVDVGVVTDRTKGANTQKEIDFVVNDADKKIYIQSAFQMESEKKEAAELSSLMLTKDFFKKVIVRMDIPHNFYDENGIFHCNLIDLLLGRVELF